MLKITISYRRADTNIIVGRIRDSLAAHYGDDSIFVDIDNVPFGKDFRTYISDQVAHSDILIVVVGRRWLGMAKGGQARIHEETDFVRLEVETALQAKVPVIPVLIGTARMPKPDQLPRSLREFPFINAAPVDTGRDFHQHIERLIRDIDQRLIEKSVSDYDRYLDHLGFSVVSKPKVRVVPNANMDGYVSQCDPDTDQIKIASSMINDLDSPRREYTNRALHQQDYTKDRDLDLFLIKSDLADYFVASFADRPELSTGTAAARNLDNQTTFDSAHPALDAWRGNRLVWGGLFWAIRNAIGPQMADQILASAWLKMAKASTEGNAPAKFIAVVMTATREVASAESERVIVETLRQRKFPI
jgi:hypothetical protein